MSLQRDLFLRCLDLPDTAARRSFLAQACGGDARLEADVRRLVALHERAGSFLEEPAAEALASRLAPQGWADDGTVRVAMAVASAPPPGAALVAGDLGSLGRVRLRRELPPSAFGPVWSGESPDAGAVTVRALDARLAALPAARGRFLLLARLLATVRHAALPVIVAVEERPWPFVVAAAIDGERLGDRLRRGLPFTPAETARAGAAVAGGLAAAHAAGLAHRALSPANVWIPAGEPESACLFDVGLARALDEDHATVDPARHACAYLAPEQVLGGRIDPLDHRPDLFALGCVLAAMATGRSPLESVTPEATLRRVAEAAVVPGALESLPESLRGVVESLLEADPGRRPSSADDVARRLAALAAAQG